MLKTHKNQIVILFFILFICSCQHTKARNAEDGQAQDSSARESGKTSQHTKSSGQTATRAASHKPSNLLLKMDFEKEEVKSVKGKENKYDQLVLYSPKGQQSAVGIYYESGKNNDRHARIIPDPKDRNNQVMHLWMKNARVPLAKKGQYKGRIQMDLSNLEKTSVYQRYRIYLHPDLALYNKYPDYNTWFCVNELWMGDKWKKHPYPFRIGLHIGKMKGAGKPLYFMAGATISDNKGNPWKSLWGHVGTNFQVPLGEWIDIELGYKAGNNNTGRFFMAAKRENDDSFTTIFDITDWTYHPDSPDIVPMSSWQPIKLYTNSNIIDYIRNNGGVTQLYFDDLEIYGDW